MAQSLFKLLKARSATTTIDVLAPAWTFSLLARMPEITHAVDIAINHGELALSRRYAIGKRLRAACYDQAIVLPNSFKSALIPWFANIKTRIGWVGECRYGVLTEARRLDKKRYPLMIEQFMALGLAANAPLPTVYPYPSFAIPTAAALATVAKHQLSWQGKPVLALCAGAAFGDAKRWPETYFATVANEHLRNGWAVWLFGSANDKPVNDHIQSLTEQRVENLSGRLQLAETIDLLSLVMGVVTNDSGLMHVAAALKKPQVAIFGATSPDFTPPLADNAHVLKLNLACQPCFARTCPLTHHRCMRDLTPDRVLALTQTWSVS